MRDTPQTLLDAARYFADLDRCEAYWDSIRPGGDAPVNLCGPGSVVHTVQSGRFSVALREASEQLAMFELMALHWRMVVCGLQANA